MGQMVLDAGGVPLDADVTVPDDATGAVVFAHGSGSSRHSPRNRFVAEELNRSGLATVLVDLLTTAEELVDEIDGRLRFDIGLLASRVTGTVDHLDLGLPLGVFGASTGGAAALVTAADRPDQVRAVVSRGGRPDLAGPALTEVRAPTLLVVGGQDPMVLDLNQRARGVMDAPAELAVIPGATHLFEEPGALEQVAVLAADWFTGKLPA
jgi:putative phosphoribosyl transferase